MGVVLHYLHAMPAFIAGIHVLLSFSIEPKTWMAGTSSAMTNG